MTDEPAPDPIPPNVGIASPEEIVEALSYALRYDERGKPQRGGWEFAAGIAAERLAEHLRRSGFVIMKALAAVPIARLTQQLIA